MVKVFLASKLKGNISMFSNMKKKYLLLLLLCMLCSVTCAKPSQMDSIAVKMSTIEQRMAAFEQEMYCVEKEVTLCEKEVSAVNEHVDCVNEAVANQIAASSHTIQVWGIIIAILAFGFGFYINRMWKQIEEAMAGAKMLQQLHSDIQNNMQTIYNKLRREETISLLRRLVDVPEDISNISKILLARNLEKEDFSMLSEAYHNLILRCAELSNENDISKLRKKNSNFVDWEASYAIQFAQHFMDKAIVVPDIRAILQPRFKLFFCRCFFKNDAEKSTRDFKQGVSSLREALQAELLSDYIYAMSQSPYAMYADWYKLLLADLSEQQLNDIWDSVIKRNKGAIFFAESIKESVLAHNPKSAKLEEIEAYIKNVKEEKAKVKEA